jgi:hypothetical protein
VKYRVRPLTPAAMARISGTGNVIAPFSASLTSTDNLLDRELRMLRASDVVLMVDCAESDIRIDGQLRASARLAKPGVALAFNTRHKGALLFGCGRFRNWQDNLRAIALGLEALRKIERYGIVQSDEQYEGWRAIPQSTSAVIPNPWHVIAAAARMTEDEARLDPRRAVRLARLRTHPDTNDGDRSGYDHVEAAARVLGLAS